MHTRRDTGSTVVEAAMIFPLILILVLGVIDLARAFFDAATVQEAAQEGAIYAALHPTDPGGAITRAEETINSTDFVGAITVTCPASDQVSVTASYTFNLITPFIGRIVGNSLDLTHTETAQVLSTDACIPS